MPSDTPEREVDEPELALTYEEIKAWADDVGADAIDHRESKNAVVCTWGAGEEIWFYQDGQVVLRKFKVLGGAEPNEMVERQGSRIVVTDSRGEEHRISGREFPIDR
jgi:hypothetical protein